MESPTWDECYDDTPLSDTELPVFDGSPTWWDERDVELPAFDDDSEEEPMSGPPSPPSPSAAPAAPAAPAAAPPQPDTTPCENHAWGPGIPWCGGADTLGPMTEARLTLMLMLLNVRDSEIQQHKGDHQRLWDAVRSHPKRDILLKNNCGKRWRRKVPVHLLTLVAAGQGAPQIALAWDNIAHSWGSWTAEEKAAKKRKRSAPIPVEQMVVGSSPPVAAVADASTAEARAHAADTGSVYKAASAATVAPVTQDDEIPLLMMISRMEDELERRRGSESTLISPLPFARVVKEISDECDSGLRWQAEALLELHKAAEDYLVRVFEDADVVSYHASNRKKQRGVTERDVLLASRLVS